MQKIVPHLWFDKEAVEAAHWYTSLFENSAIIGLATIPGTPSGDAETVDFQLANLRFSAISAGPYFRFNPSVSLMVSCGTLQEVSRLYTELSVDSSVLMPLGEYPFSQRYGWVQDRYGLTWQLILVDKVDEQNKIRPNLLFAGPACGMAVDAIDYYISIFDSSTKGYISHYSEGEARDKRAQVNYAEFSIGENQFIAMDHGLGGDFTFNEAFSFVVLCDDQAEIDKYWDKLSFVPEAEQCGWLKDKFGVSWQIVPINLRKVLMHGTKEEVKRVTDAFLKMKKLDMAAIETARLG